MALAEGAGPFRSHRRGERRTLTRPAGDFLRRERGEEARVLH